MWSHPRVAHDPVQEVARRPDLCSGKQHAVTSVPVSQFTKVFVALAARYEVRRCPFSWGNAASRRGCAMQPVSRASRCVVRALHADWPSWASLTLGLPSAGLPNLHQKLSSLTFSLPSSPSLEEFSSLGKGFDLVVWGVADTGVLGGPRGQPRLPPGKPRFPPALLCQEGGVGASS